MNDKNLNNNSCDSIIDNTEVEKPEKEEVLTENHTCPECDQLKSELKQLEEKNRELHERYIRLYADFENYRKRVHRDYEMMKQLSLEKFFTEMIPVLDHLILVAYKIKKEEKADVLEAISIVVDQLFKVLEHAGMKIFDGDGKFDPYYHEAVDTVETDDPAKVGMIAGQWRKGYMLADKVLRPAQVIVYKWKEKDNKDLFSENVNDVKNEQNKKEV